MASPVRQFDAVEDQERLLDIVRALVSELGHQSALTLVGPGAHLDRELGLGSLERVELLARLEKAFGVRLEEGVLAEAETVQDLISALSGSAGKSAAVSARADGNLAAFPANFRRMKLPRDFPPRKHFRMCCVCAGARTLRKRT